MSGFSTKVVLLDGDGNGVVNVGPGLYYGSSDETATVTNNGDALGNDYTESTAQFVVGDLVCAGTPDTELALYVRHG